MLERLQKYLARAGVASRRHAEAVSYTHLFGFRLACVCRMVAATVIRDVEELLPITIKGEQPMMNLVWVLMILGGIIAAAVNGRIDVVANSIVSGGEQAITLCLALLAVLSFWMGLARVAERAGDVYKRQVMESPPVTRPYFSPRRGREIFWLIFCWAVVLLCCCLLYTSRCV